MQAWSGLGALWPRNPAKGGFRIPGLISHETVTWGSLLHTGIRHLNRGRSEKALGGGLGQLPRWPQMWKSLAGHGLIVFVTEKPERGGESPGKEGGA